MDYITKINKETQNLFIDYKEKGLDPHIFKGIYLYSSNLFLEKASKETRKNQKEFWLNWGKFIISMLELYINTIENQSESEPIKDMINQRLDLYISNIKNAEGEI